MTVSTRTLALPSLLLLSGCSLVFAPSNYSSGADLGAIDGGSTDLGLTDAPPSDLGGIRDDGATPDLGGDAGPRTWPRCDGLDRPTPLVDVYGAAVDVPTYLQLQWTGSSSAAFARLPNDFDLEGFGASATLTAVSIAADTDPTDATADNLYVALGGSAGGIRLLRLSVDALGARAIAEERLLDTREFSPVVDVSIAVRGTDLSVAAVVSSKLYVWTGTTALGDFADTPAMTPAAGALRVAHAEMWPVYLDGAGAHTPIGTTFPTHPFTPSTPAVLIGSQGPLVFSRSAGVFTAWNTRSGEQMLGNAPLGPQWLTGAYFLRTPTEGATRQHVLLEGSAEFTLAYAGTTICTAPAFTGCRTEGSMLSAPSPGYIVDVAQAGAHRLGAADPITDFIVAGTSASMGSTDGTEVRVFPFVTDDLENRTYWNPAGITIASGTVAATGGSVGTLSDVESAVTSNSAGVGVFAVALVQLGAEPAPLAYLSGFRACATPP